VRGEGGKRGKVKMGGAGLIFGLLTLTHSITHGSLRKLAENMKIPTAADTLIKIKNKNKQHLRSPFPRFLDFYRIRKKEHP
jgi:hypothetical protein